MEVNGLGSFPPMAALREIHINTVSPAAQCMKKRGIVDIQFNWIFIIIAGALILMFFVSLINKQRSLSDIRSSQTIASNLDSILTGAQISTDTSNTIDLPAVPISFSCDDFSVGPVRRNLLLDIVFSPSLLRGKKMITWALDWSVPFRVANFLYLTDPELRYIIVDNAKNLGRKIVDAMPKEVNKEVVARANVGSLIDKNNYHVRFVFLGDPPDTPFAQFQGMDPDAVSAVSFPDLADKGDILTTGRAAFYSFDKADGKFKSPQATFYLKEESFFGALFAPGADGYNCAMKKAFRKLERVAEMYASRSISLQQYYGPGNPCSTHHRSNTIQEIGIAAKSQSEKFPTTLADIQEIQENARRLGDEQNQQLQLISCPLIY